MQQQFSITILGENNLGLLVRIITIISRRRIAIRQMDVRGTEQAQVQRISMLIREEEEVIRKLMQQIEKQVDVIKTSFHLAQKQYNGDSLETASVHETGSVG